MAIVSAIPALEVHVSSVMSARTWGRTKVLPVRTWECFFMILDTYQAKVNITQENLEQDLNNF